MSTSDDQATNFGLSNKSESLAVSEQETKFLASSGDVIELDDMDAQVSLVRVAGSQVRIVVCGQLLSGKFGQADRKVTLSFRDIGNEPKATVQMSIYVPTGVAVVISPRFRGAFQGTFGDPDGF